MNTDCKHPAVRNGWCTTCGHDIFAYRIKESQGPIDYFRMSGNSAQNPDREESTWVTFTPQQEGRPKRRLLNQWWLTVIQFWILIVWLCFFFPKIRSYFVMKAIRAIEKIA